MWLRRGGHLHTQGDMMQAGESLSDRTICPPPRSCTAPYTPDVDNAGSTLLVCCKGQPPRPYDAEVHSADTAYRSTDETYALFTEEVRVLMWSIEVGQKDLQAYSAANITSRYPLYARELLHIIDALDRAKTADLAAIDMELGAAIRERVSLLSSVLLADETLPEMLNSFIRPQLIALLPEMEDATIKAIVSNCVPDRTANMAGLIDAFVNTQLAPKAERSMGDAFRGDSHSVKSDTTTTPEQSDEKHTRSTPTVEQMVRENNTIIKRAIFAAILQCRIIIPASSGFGMSRRQRPGEKFDYMNQDFRFWQGEILLITPDIRSIVNASGNVVVENARGEVGEIHGTVKLRAVQDALDGSFMPPPPTRPPGDHVHVSMPELSGAGGLGDAMRQASRSSRSSSLCPADALLMQASDGEEQSEVHGLPSRKAKCPRHLVGDKSKTKKSSSHVIELTAVGPPGAVEGDRCGLRRFAR
ncbi:hypothetical protein LTR95_008877 [Oleoguttula sp. CCFEE 5521]